MDFIIRSSTGDTLSLTRMLSSVPQEGTFVDTALELLSHAIDAEDNQDYTGAYAKYMAALDYLMAAQQSETNEKSRIFLQTKADEYLNRAETLRQRIDANKCEGPLVRADLDTPAGHTRAVQSIILDEAFKCTKQAIEADASRDYAEAYKQYMKSMDYFMFAQRYELNDHSKSLIRANVGEYLLRAETIKSHLNSLRDPRETSSVNDNINKGPPRPPETVFLHAAIQISERAIQQDSQKNYRPAYELYNGGLDFFMLAHKYEKNEQSKVVIRATMEEYLARAEALKKFLG